MRAADDFFQTFAKFTAISIFMTDKIKTNLADIPSIIAPRRNYSEHAKKSRRFAAGFSSILSIGYRVKSLKIDYLMILATTPEPTVLPPSRIAKRRPSSQAIGVIRVTSIVMWSPGITISTPSGSLMVPVTSVVLK